MSMALSFGFIVAYTMNWWLVAKGLKHGMMTVRPHGAAPTTPMAMAAGHGHSVGHSQRPSAAEIAVMAALSVVAFALAIGLAPTLANRS